MSCTCLLSTGVLIIGGTVCAGSRGHGCVAVTTGGLAESSINHERFIALAPARLHTCMVTAESIRLRRLVQSTSPCCTLQKGFTQISKAKAENRTCSAQLCLLSGGTSPHPPLQVNTQDVNQCIQIQQRASKGAFKSKQCSEFACLLEVKCMYSLCTM